MHNSFYVSEKWKKNSSHKNIYYQCSTKMFTRRVKPIRITSVRISEVQLYFILALGHTSLPFNRYCGLFV